jgi:hypothetical protein
VENNPLVGMPRIKPSVFGQWITAAYAVGFFLAVAAAPHRHVNSIEDLFSDGPSDSGFVLGPTARCEGGGPVLERLLNDDPCLACFHHDFVAAAVSAFVLWSPSATLTRIDAGVLPATPDPNTQSPASRSPPAAA